ncbi:MAG TPA: UvrD-helicase domain-containing protein [Microlunatus sp.]
MTESQIILSRTAMKFDPTIRSKVTAFLQKVTENDASKGLRIEPIHGTVDPRVRTGRVDLAYRAVLFQLDQDRERFYVLYGIWHHDEAIERAKRARLSANPLNGVPAIEETEPTPVAVPQSATPSPEHELPTILGHSATELVEGLGLDPDVAEQVARCTDEDELIVFAEKLGGWRGLALFDMSSGDSIEQVREQYGLSKPADDSDATLLDSLLRSPAARTEFTYVEDADELRRIIESGDFIAWRTWLHPSQRRVVEATYNGSYRLSGGAGTGKTVVLLHRARRLARADQRARVLATTFTTNLAEQMRQDLRTLDPGLPVSDSLGRPGLMVAGVDSVAAAVLREASDQVGAAAAQLFGSSRSSIAQRTDAAEAWRTALASAGSNLPEPLRSVSFVEAEYATVVLPNRITTLDEYVRIPRPGRGVRLSRSQRRAVWEVVLAYRAGATTSGMIDYGEAAALAAVALDLRAAGGGARPFDHVVVDEGQDLDPAHLQLIRALVAEGPDDVFIAEDSHQRIYGQRVVMSRYGLNIRGRSSRLRLNYRTTAENLGLARRILAGADWVDAEDEPEASSDYRSLRNGPEPRIVRAESLTDEYDKAAELLRTWLAEVAEQGLARESIGVLVRDSRQRDRVVSALAERGVETRAVDRKAISTGRPAVLTMHRSKGTEFAKVLLLGVSDRSVPAVYVSRTLPEEERTEAMLRERALLYVASSRARDELVISYSGEPSSLLPG